ncbi:MAG TPA: hypothetical protein VIK91_06775, partial [Nannocystis sp.]
MTPSGDSRLLTIVVLSFWGVRRSASSPVSCPSAGARTKPRTCLLMPKHRPVPKNRDDVPSPDPQTPVTVPAAV